MHVCMHVADLITCALRDYPVHTHRPLDQKPLAVGSAMCDHGRHAEFRGYHVGAAQRIEEVECLRVLG